MLCASAFAPARTRFDGARRSPTLPNVPASDGSLPTDRPRLARELVLFGIALLAGTVLVPLLIWLVGDRALGPYTRTGGGRGGPLALLLDFLNGLAHGYRTFWLVALGPAILLLLVRLLIASLRYRPESAHETPAPRTAGSPPQSGSRSVKSQRR